eukprot:190438-Pleurochrysis_carterae.AAC.6
MPLRVRKNAIPLGHVKGPENKSNTRREVLMAEARAVGARWRGAGMAGSVNECKGGGSRGAGLRWRRMGWRWHGQPWSAAATGGKIFC